MLLSPFEKGWGPSFEQNWIYITRGCFVRSLLEISPVVLEKKIFEFCQYILTLLLLSPLGKGHGPSFDQTWIPFTYGSFVPSSVEIGPVVLEKKKKMCSWQRRRRWQRQRRTRDILWSEKLTWAFSSGELKN